MKKAILNYEKCETEHCIKCSAKLVCNVGAIIKLDPDSSAAILNDVCNGCGKCVIECVGRAIVLVER